MLHPFVFSASLARCNCNAEQAYASLPNRTATHAVKPRSRMTANANETSHRPHAHQICMAANAPKGLRSTPVGSRCGRLQPAVGPLLWVFLIVTGCPPV